MKIRSICIIAQVICINHLLLSQISIGQSPFVYYPSVDFRGDTIFEISQDDDPNIGKNNYYRVLDKIDDFSIYQDSMNSFSNVLCSYDQLVKDSYLYNSVLNGVTKFEYSWIKKKLTFMNCEFDNLILVGSRFDSKIDLSGSSFRFPISFEELQFYNSLDFHYASLSNVTTLRQSIFSKPVYFNGSKIDDKMTFSECHFYNSLNFANSKIHSDILFYDTGMSGDLSFRGADINGTISFIGSRLPEVISFRSANIYGQIDLTKADYYLHENKNLYSENKSIEIDLYETDVSRIKFDYSFFKLLKHDFMTANDIIRVLLDIMKNQKSTNFENGYRKADIEYKFYTTNFMLFNINHYWNNFGYSPELIFRNTAIFMTLFFVIILFNFKFLVDKVYCIKSLENFKSNFIKISQDKLTLKQFILISPYAFYYMAVIFFGLKIDLGNFNIQGSLNNISWGKKIGVIFIFLIYSCGLVCTAYIANYIIQS